MIINSPELLIDNECIINKHSHISTGVIINGGYEFGESSFIGSGSTTREEVKRTPNTFRSSRKRVMGWPIK